MLTYEYKLDGTQAQYAAIDEAIRIVQFIRNKCLRLWMDTRGTNRTFTDGCGIGRLRLIGNPGQQIEAFPLTQIKRVRIVKRADGYYVQFSVQAERKVKHVPTGKQVGIDVGLKAYYTDSEGNTVENPRHSRKAEQRLKRLHRRLSRKQKKSRNRKKARKVLAKGYLKVQRQREDFARKHKNILAKAVGTLGHRETAEPRSENASGQIASTRSRRAKTGKRAG